MNSSTNNINLNIETITGRSFPVKVCITDTIHQVKIKIQRSEGIPVAHQQLIWQQIELDDKFTLRDYNIITDGVTLKMVLLLRGGPINSRRLAATATDDLLLRDVSDLIEYREDIWDTYAMKNKHVTLLVIRDGDNFNLLRVIDRGDGSPLSGDVSAASMYAPYEELDKDALLVDEEKQTENEITKEKMLLIREQLNKKHCDNPASTTTSILNSTTCNTLVPKPPSARKNSKSSALINNIRSKQYTSSGEVTAAAAATVAPSTTMTTRKLTFSRKDLEKFDIFQNIDIDASILTMNYADLLQAELNPNTYGVDDEIYYEDNEEENDVDEEDVDDAGDSDDVCLDPTSTTSELLLHKSVLIANKLDDEINDDSTPPSGLGQILHDLISMPHESGDVKQDQHELTSAQSILSRNNTSSKMLQSNISISNQQNINTNNDELLPPFSQQQQQQQQEPNFSQDTLFNKKSSFSLMRQLSTEDSKPAKLSFQQKYFFNSNLFKRNTQINPLPMQPPAPTLPQATSTIGAQNYQESTFSLLPNKPHNHPLHPLMYPRGSISGSSALTKNNLSSKANKEERIQTPNNNNSNNNDRLLFSAKLKRATETTPKLPPVVKPTKTDSTRYCGVIGCGKKMKIATTYTCRCGNMYCPAHRYAEAHNCTYDYKTEGRKILEQCNPLVAAPKLPKI